MRVRVCTLLQLLKDQSSASKSFYRLLVDFNSWICKIMLRSQVMPSFAYLECHCSLFRRLRSEIVHGILLLYLVVSSRTLAIGSCNNVKRAARLY